MYVAFPSVFQDILKDAIENNLQSAADMPYFEGDFWPNVLEESIKELDQEEEEKRKREEAEAALIAAEAEEPPEEPPDSVEVRYRLAFYIDSGNFRNNIGNQVSLLVCMPKKTKLKCYLLIFTAPWWRSQRQEEQRTEKQHEEKAEEQKCKPKKEQQKIQSSIWWE